MTVTQTEQDGCTGGRCGAVLGWASRRPRLVLALFCLLLWAPGIFSLPPLDRDESRFAQASKQMLETGDPIDIRLGAVPRYKKPAGIYWMQAFTATVFGLGERSQIWAYRLTSLFGAIVAVWLTFWCAGAFLRREAAFLAAALLGGTLLLTAEATIATTDAVLTACILGAQAVLMRLWLAAKGEAPPLPLAVVIAGWVAFGLAILVKGPVVFAVTGLTVLGVSLWSGNWRWLAATRPLIGVPLVLAMVVPWIVAIGIKSNWQFFQASLGQDFATKLQSGQESHGFPPGYFLIAVTPSFWPAVLFLLPGLIQAIRNRHEPAMQFLLVWAAVWVMFELVPTKLPHYVLPLYPALAIMAAVWATGTGEDEHLLDRIVFFVPPLQFLLMAVALAAAPVVLPAVYGAGPMWWALVPAVVFAAVAGAALVFYFRRRLLAAALLAIAAPLAVYPVLTAGAGPALSRIWVTPRLAAMVESFSREGDKPPALAGYIEPSTLFMLGTETRLTDSGRSAADAKAVEGGLAVIEAREEAAFTARLKEREVEAARLGTIGGLNYSNGRKVHIGVWRVEPLTEMPPPPAE